MDRAIARLHTTVYDKPYFYREIVRHVAMISYNILYYMYDNVYFDRVIVQLHKLYKSIIYRICM